MILLIRNIDRTIPRAEIHSLLARYGQVESFDLVMDEATGQSKGFGFAKMRTDVQGALVIRELDGRVIGTSPLRVKKAAPSSLRKGRQVGKNPLPPPPAPGLPRRKLGNGPRARQKMAELKRRSRDSG